MTGKVTVFPVPVTRTAEQEEAADPARMAEEIERLKGENAVLRERLTAVQTIALEREETIEDLRHALQMLPSAWAEKLGSSERSDPDGPDIEASPPENGTPSADSSVPPSAIANSPEEPSPSEASVDQAEVLFAEVAALRARLERRRLEVEQEILDQERRKLQADIDWTRKWQRSRSARPTTP